MPIIDGGGAEFTVFAITSDSLGNESASELDRFIITVGEAGISQKIPKFGIKLLSIDGVQNHPLAGKSKTGKSKAPGILLVSGNGGDCCVSCDGITVCANAVCIPGCGQCHDKGVLPIPNCNVDDSQVQLSKFRPLDLKPLNLTKSQSADANEAAPAGGAESSSLANRN